MNARELWDRYRAWLFDDPELGVRVDVSRMNLTEEFIRAMADPMGRAFDGMEALERGAVANPDEQRMVGHYWLRAPELAPSDEIRRAIESSVVRVLAFADRVHSGDIKPSHAERFRHCLVVGIGGSALGPQFVADALSGPADPMTPHFLDNTDPDGIDRVLRSLGPELARTLTVVVSKSGGTPETRNGMLETAAAYRELGLELGPHAVAITQDGSKLDEIACEQRFLERFPMWDWVGGRTSELSAVGLLPAALQGFDVRGMLEGAAVMDRMTRTREIARNPAALLALSWYHAGDGKGKKDMVVLPYKDRLALFSRYLQQLVMESLGKERDLDGNVVHQGIAVYGNKGSTDQHAYVQQLREGVSNFFVTFVEVLRSREGESIEVEPDATSGDFLAGFLLGTREALYENGRPSLTITVPDVSARSVGLLIALYERAVGLYASLVNVNAYHQPGVEAGKKAAAAILELQRALLHVLRKRGEDGGTCEELAEAAGETERVETAFMILEQLSADPARGIVRTPGSTPFDAVYRYRTR
jgi:glucose-6-phosphate isomerase